MGNPPLIVGLLINGAPGEFMGGHFLCASKTWRRISASKTPC
jgi:hypothetical protein